MKKIALTMIALAVGLNIPRVHAEVFDYAGYTVTVLSNDWAPDVANPYNSDTLSTETFTGNSQVYDLTNPAKSYSISGPTYTFGVESSALTFHNPNISITASDGGVSSASTGISVVVQAKPGWTVTLADWSGDGGQAYDYVGSTGEAVGVDVSTSGTNASVNWNSDPVSTGGYYFYGEGMGSFSSESFVSINNQLDYIDPTTGDSMESNQLAYQSVGEKLIALSETVNYKASTIGPGSYAKIWSNGGDGDLSVIALTTNPSTIPEPEIYVSMLAGIWLLGVVFDRKVRNSATGRAG